MADPEILMPVTDPAVTRELEALAARHRNASGVGMQVLTYLGGSAESLMSKLPAPVRDGLEGATARALENAFDLAQRSRGTVSDRPDWMNTALSTAMGVVGGAGGIATSLAEVPFTVTVLLRSIQGIAQEFGFDPSTQEVRVECLRVFASAGPMAKDDGADMAFVAAKVTITGQGLQGLISKVAPKLAGVLGQKLAAQAAPVLGAVAGAAVNYSFTSYYQEIARVHFGLKALARDRGLDEGLMREELIARIAKR